jgi:hypothetical protein
MSALEAIESARRALSALLLAGMFVSEPGVWPGFVAFVERQTGKEWAATPQDMTVAIQIADTMRDGLGLPS